MYKLIAAVALALTTACSIEPRQVRDTDAETELDLNDTADSLIVTLTAPTAAARGDLVPITVTLRNITTRPLDLALMGREIVFDIIVSHDGSQVWQRLAGQTIPGILQLKTLQPDETLRFTDSWQANVSAGSYDVTARIPTDDAPLESSPRTITIR